MSVLVEHVFEHNNFRPELEQVSRPEGPESRFAWFPGIIVSVPGWQEAGRGDWEDVPRSELPTGTVVAVEDSPGLDGKLRLLVLWDKAPHERDHLRRVWREKLRAGRLM